MKTITQETDTLESFFWRRLKCRIKESPLTIENPAQQIAGPCGYVGIPHKHPLFGKGYNYELCGHSDCYEHTLSFDVHGGLTYAGEGWWNDGLWYFGFDTGHYGDTRATRTKEYVHSECQKLAKQLANYKAKVSTEKPEAKP